MNDLLDHALKYAALGWHVLPIVPKQKIPLTKHGVKDATADINQIKAWWKKWPDANIAVTCGTKSSVWVIDVDVEQATDVNGYESLKEFPPLPKTVKQNTPRGGFHAFYRSDNAPVNRNSFRPGIDIRGDGYYVVVAPSLHPNRGRYGWIDGHAPWQIKPAKFPDFMRPTTKAPWGHSPIAFKGVPVTLNSTLSGLSDDDIRQRTSLYLAECEPAVQGSGGHDKLLWAAVALVHGFLLSDDQALDLLTREYNPRCVPPWQLDNKSDAKDFRRKVSEARKLTPKEGPGWLLNDPAYASIDAADVMSTEEIIELIKNSRKEAWEAAEDSTRNFQSAKANVALNEELQFLTRPTGLLGKICSWINSTAIKEQPFLTLACALTFCGVLFGRKIRDETGNRTNLYCMGVAPSSAGKAHAPNQIRRLCAAAGCTDLLGGDDFASDAAIEAKLAIQPATLFLCDEIGYMLSHIKSGVNYHQAKIVPLLMKLYSAASSIYKGREYAEEEKQRILVQPCCCLYGTSTPERFSSGITEEELEDGWLSRCLIFTTKYDPPKNRDIAETPVPSDLADQVRAWALRENDYSSEDGDISSFVEGSSALMTPVLPGQLVVLTDTPAGQIFVYFDNEAISLGRVNPKFACLWKKAEENARRIAVILAASENFDNPRITPAIAEYACRLMRFLLFDFSMKTGATISSNQIDLQKQKLLSIIAKAGVEGCLTREITRAARWSTKRQRMDLLADLVEAQEVVQRAKDTRGVYHWTVDNFRKFQEQGNV